MDALANLGINFGYLLIQILGMIIIYLAIRGWLAEPITRTLEERKARIAKGLEDARQAAIARDNADAEAKKILDAARAEAASIRSDATVQAEDAAKSIRKAADEEAAGIREAARADAETERDRILADLRSQVASIAIAAANKLVGDGLDEKRQRTLVNEFFSKVPEGMKNLSGATVVTSALPLTDDEKANALKAMGVGDATFRVDPSILGGLVVRSGDQVIDNSVAGQMSAMRESLS